MCFFLPSFSCTSFSQWIASLKLTTNTAIDAIFETFERFADKMKIVSILVDSVILYLGLSDNVSQYRSSIKGMDHNSGLTEAEDVDLYLKRDMHNKGKAGSKPYSIIRDETVGR